MSKNLRFAVAAVAITGGLMAASHATKPTNTTESQKAEMLDGVQFVLQHRSTAGVDCMELGHYTRAEVRQYKAEIIKSINNGDTCKAIIPPSRNDRIFATAQVQNLTK